MYNSMNVQLCKCAVPYIRHLQQNIFKHICVCPSSFISKEYVFVKLRQFFDLENKPIKTISIQFSVSIFRGGSRTAATLQQS